MNPRVGEIWELPSRHLARVAGLRPSTRFEGARVQLVDLVDEGLGIELNLYAFLDMVRVHPPPVTEVCVVCGRANGAEGTASKRVLLFGCGSQRCAASVCTMPGHAGVLSCQDQHTDSHHAEIDRENAERELAATNKQRKGA